jgi:hypothetical protein
MDLDDLAIINRALLNWKTVFIPANTNCAVHISASNSIIMNDGNRLMRTNCHRKSPRYLMPTNSILLRRQALSINVASNVATVTTW